MDAVETSDYDASENDYINANSAYLSSLRQQYEYENQQRAGGNQYQHPSSFRQLLNSSNQQQQVGQNILSSPPPSQNIVPQQAPESRSNEGEEGGVSQNTFLMNLIMEVRKYRCIWDHTSNSWRETPLKKNAWQKISQSLNVENVSYLEKEFKKLKDNFRKCLNRQKKETRSGSSGRPLATCNFYKELCFMRDVLSSRETQSNINANLLSPPPSPVIPLSSPPFNVSSESLNSLHQGLDEAHSNSRCSEADYNNNSNNATTISTPAPKNPKKRKRNDESTTDGINERILTAIEKDISFNSTEHKVEKEKDSNQLFCESLVESLKNLPTKKNKLARMKIMQVLYDLDDSSDEM